MRTRLYKYVPPERIDIVRDLRVRFTPPGYLSDPFECRLAFPRPSAENTTAPSNGSQPDEDELIRLWRRMASIEWGILCLTERPDNLVMWAHYAAAHRGVVLEFDSENSFFNKTSVRHLDWTWMEEMPLRCPGFGNLREVEYSGDRPSSSDPDEIPVSSFFAKSPHWAYEEEVRMVMPLSDADVKSDKDALHLFQFPADALTGVILGAGVKTDLTEELKAILATEKLGHVCLQRASLSLSTFAMDFVKA